MIGQMDHLLEDVGRIEIFLVILKHVVTSLRRPELLLSHSFFILQPLDIPQLALFLLLTLGAAVWDVVLPHRFFLLLDGLQVEF